MDTSSILHYTPVDNIFILYYRVGYYLHSSANMVNIYLKIEDRRVLALSISLFWPHPRTFQCHKCCRC